MDLASTTVRSEWQEGNQPIRSQGCALDCRSRMVGPNNNLVHTSGSMVEDTKDHMVDMKKHWTDNNYHLVATPGHLADTSRTKLPTQLPKAPTASHSTCPCWCATATPRMQL